MVSKEIGEFIMEKLMQVDEVACARFASVYRQFRDVNQFMNELRGMLNAKNERVDSLPSSVYRENLRAEI